MPATTDSCSRSVVGPPPAKWPKTERSDGIQVIARAAKVLRHLARERDGSSIAELAASLDLPRSTTHRIVAALSKEGLVRGTSSGRYGLGPELLSLAVADRQGLHGRLAPHLQRLSARLGETVDLAMLSDEEVLFVDQSISRQMLQVAAQVGTRFPVYCTASGKALLATLPRWRVERLLPGTLHALTPRTVTSRRALLDELDQVRRDGVAYDFEEHSLGISAIAVAITDRYGETAALSVVVPSARFGERDEIEAALLWEWRSIQGELGRADVAVAGQVHG